MKLKYVLLLVFVSVSQILHSQGVSFSYLVPKNGQISAPVSPFSLRGVGFGERFGMETGISLYNIPGLAMKDLPFHSDKPLIGPYFATLTPVQTFVKFRSKKQSLKLLAGGFFWLNLNPKINEGNMDRAFRAYEGWQVLNTDFDLKTQPGYGWMAGIEYQRKVNRDYAITAEVQYLSGHSPTHLYGTYAGGDASGWQEKTYDSKAPSILLQGVEISLGVSFQR